MWPSGKVLASGARDRQFESGHPDFSFSPELLYEDCNNEGGFLLHRKDSVILCVRVRAFPMK